MNSGTTLQGLMDQWVTPASGYGTHVSWLVLDFGREVTLDGIRLYSHGDSIHDVSNHFFQPASRNSTNPATITWGRVVGEFTGAIGKGVDSPQDFAFVATTARVWRWVVTGVHPSSNCAEFEGSQCQPDVAELEFHEAANKPGARCPFGNTIFHSRMLSVSTPARFEASMRVIE
jgi:hypothetical protein